MSYRSCNCRRLDQMSRWHSQPQAGPHHTFAELCMCDLKPPWLQQIRTPLHCKPSLLCTLLGWLHLETFALNRVSILPISTVHTQAAANAKAIRRCCCIRSNLLPSAAVQQIRTRPIRRQCRPNRLKLHPIAHRRRSAKCCIGSLVKRNPCHVSKQKKTTPKY